MKDIRDKLIPVLKASEAPESSVSVIQLWANQLVDECKNALSQVLPFNKDEIEFLERFEQQGELCPELISKNQVLCHRINSHPLLHWRKQSRVIKT